jgi:hypothetical protein
LKERSVPSYILKSLITLRDEITERLMQNSEFRALQSLQRSIEEVSALAEEDARVTHFRPAAQAPAAAPTHSEQAPLPDLTSEASLLAAARAGAVSRVTPAHFAAAAKRII